MKTLQIAYLADHPDLAPRLAEWFCAEWGGRNPEFNKALFEKRLRERMHRNVLPLTLVAFLGEELVASASLKLQEMETRPQFLYWLGSVYVDETFRGRGIGSQLVRHAAKRASALGVEELYLYTHSHEAYYARLGWRDVERPQYHGREVVIMKRSVAAGEDRSGLEDEPFS